MRAMVFEASREPAARGRASRSREPRAGPAAARGRGLRRLPHRPAPARRRGRDRRSRRASSATRSSARCSPARRSAGEPRRRAVAGLDRAASAATAAAGARTSARAPASPAATSTAAIAEYAVADARFCFPLPDGYPDEQAAPLLCAGLIGYRALRMCGDARAPRPLRLRRRGAHPRPGRRPPGPAGVRLHPRGGRRRRGASPASSAPIWAGASEEQPPEPLDAAIIFAPVGELVPLALRALAPGGTVVCARHPHERHPLLPLRAAVARADAPLGRQPDPPRGGGDARAGARASPSGPTVTVTPSSGPPTPSRTSAMVRSGEPP